MRVRRASPLLLLLAPSLVSSSSQHIPSSPQQQPQHLLRKRDAQGALLVARQDGGAADIRTTPAKSSPSSRPYRGTEDAPVDGLDGKPHAGPWVDSTRDEDGGRKEQESARPTSMDKFASSPDGRWKLEDIPERNDGVMDDDTRVAPKKGTTGTEGGISEKERQRKEAGLAVNTPQEPKEAPPLPADFIEQGIANTNDNGGSGAKSGDYHGGLERPDDLPDRPHDLPYPDRTGSNAARSSNEPPVDGGSNGWLKDTMPYTEGKTNPKASSPPKVLLASTPSSEKETWHEWFHSFVLSLTMILVSEIGDKTFLVAALMAMRHSTILVFSAAYSALIVMTVLSAVLGHVVPTLLPKRLTTFAAALLFLVFGAKMIREGLAMPKDSGVGEEMKEVEAELEEKEHSMAMQQQSSRRGSSLSPYALESGPRGRQAPMNKLPNGGEPSPPASRSPSPSDHHRRKRTSSGLMNLCSLVFSPPWVQTFIMTFLGEWGDRSQIATIAMAAGQDYWNVTLGALLGHACCTGLAVVGGRALAGRVSMRVVTIGGAVAFLAFGVIYLFECISNR